MDCSKCINKCKAECCSIVPIPVNIYNKYKNKLKKDLLIYEVDEYIIAYDEKRQRCGFLGEDMKCMIYEDIPIVCKMFGDESALMLTCPWLDKDGKIRSRSSRRRINKEQLKKQESIKKQNK